MDANRSTAPDPMFSVDAVPPSVADAQPQPPCDSDGSLVASGPSAGEPLLAATASDPAANCGMPVRPLSPSQSSASSASSAVRTRPSPPRARGGAGGEAPRPLPDRCWDLFCEGRSYSAIGRLLGLDRETVARYVAAMHKEIQAERRADLTLALSRALATQEKIQAVAWTLLAQATAPTDAQATAPAPSFPARVEQRSASGPPPRARGGAGGEASLADCARLLNIIVLAAREAARLELLYARDAPSRQGDAGEQQRTVRLIIERVGDPYVDPGVGPSALSSATTLVDSGSDPQQRG